MGRWFSGRMNRARGLSLIDDDKWISFIQFFYKQSLLSLPNCVIVIKPSYETAQFRAVFIDDVNFKGLEYLEFGHVNSAINFLKRGQGLSLWGHATSYQDGEIRLVVQQVTLQVGVQQCADNIQSHKYTVTTSTKHVWFLYTPKSFFKHWCQLSMESWGLRPKKF